MSAGMRLHPYDQSCCPSCADHGGENASLKPFQETSALWVLCVVQSAFDDYQRDLVILSAWPPLVPDIQRCGSVCAGHGPSHTSLKQPQEITALWSLGVVQVACGDHHTAALTLDGKVYTFGRNKYGQLGLGHFRNAESPQPVMDLREPVAQIACGANHTVAVAR